MSSDASSGPRAPHSSQDNRKGVAGLVVDLNDVAAIVWAMAQARGGPADIRKFNATVPVAEGNGRRRPYLPFAGCWAVMTLMKELPSRCMSAWKGNRTPLALFCRRIGHL